VRQISTVPFGLTNEGTLHLRTSRRLRVLETPEKESGGNPELEEMLGGKTDLEAFARKLDYENIGVFRAALMGWIDSASRREQEWFCPVGDLRLDGWGLGLGITGFNNEFEVEVIEPAEAIEPDRQAGSDAGPSR
jgi:hypothetical protein